MEQHIPWSFQMGHPGVSTITTTVQKSNDIGDEREKMSR